MTNTLKESLTTIKSILTGMGITWRHLYGPTVTQQYPEVQPILPAGTRSKLYVNMDDCIGCSLCAKACPVNCIDIETIKSTANTDLGKTSDGKTKKLWVTKFNIDMAKCMYCNLCVYPCPTVCIYMVPDFEFSDYDRNNLLFQFSTLTPEKVTEVTEMAEKEALEKLIAREAKETK